MKIEILDKDVREVFDFINTRVPLEKRAFVIIRLENLRNLFYRDISNDDDEIWNQELFRLRSDTDTVDP